MQKLEFRMVISLDSGFQPSIDSHMSVFVLVNFVYFCH